MNCTKKKNNGKMNGNILAKGAGKHTHTHIDDWERERVEGSRTKKIECRQSNAMNMNKTLF